MERRKNENGDIEWTLAVSKEEFETAVGRKPTEEEFEDFARNCEKAVENSIDWDIVFNVASEDFKLNK